MTIISSLIAAFFLAAITVFICLGVVKFFDLLFEPPPDGKPPGQIRADQ